MLNKETIYELEKASLPEALLIITELFPGQVIFSSSLGQEDQVITDAICKNNIGILIKAVVKNIEYKLDVNSLQQQPVNDGVKLNEVVKATIKLASPLVYDTYATLKETGSAILIDETSNHTAAAVLIQ